MRQYKWLDIKPVESVHLKPVIELSTKFRLRVSPSDNVGLMHVVHMFSEDTKYKNFKHKTTDTWQTDYRLASLSVFSDH